MPCVSKCSAPFNDAMIITFINPELHTPHADAIIIDRAKSE